MNSTNQKKPFRADREGIKKLTRSAQRKLTVTCVAVAAVVLILLGAGLGYFDGHRAEGENVSLEKMENSITGQMREEMAAASSYLEKLDGSIAENQKKLDEVNRQLVERQESLLKVETTQKKLEENASGTSEKISELEKSTETKIESLQKDMDSMRADIRTAMEKISSMIASLEKAEQSGASNHDQTMEEFSKVNQAVLDINQSIRLVEENLKRSHESLYALLEELKMGEEKNQSELVRKLSDVEKDLNGLLHGDMVQITGAFEKLSENLQAQVSELGAQMDGSFRELNRNMSGGFTNIDQSLEEKLRQMNETILMQFTDLTSGNGQSMEELMAYMDALSGTFRQDMNQVFTSVSNGKKRLASALLTKGVGIKGDATFEQIRDAILSIEQQLVIGVQEIPGTISYEYHYHQDASGSYVHAERSDVQGGCFTVEATHTHVSDCYTTTKVHVHNDNCPTRTYYVDWVEEPYWARDYTCNNQPLNSNEKTLICGKKKGEAEGYMPACGLVDGQIIGAHIVYDKERVEADAAAGNIGKPDAGDESGEPQEDQEESLTETDTEESGDVPQTGEESEESDETETEDDSQPDEEESEAETVTETGQEEAETEQEEEKPKEQEMESAAETGAENEGIEAPFAETSVEEDKETA